MLRVAQIYNSRKSLNSTFREFQSPALIEESHLSVYIVTRYVQHHLLSTKAHVYSASGTLSISIVESSRSLRALWPTHFESTVHVLCCLVAHFVEH